ncbi:hypothetical protein [Streptomyces sp. NPDC056512]|uniref:hypothetical protein n=1 Tax=unclassified Streptomyces TaxID=2593676 RepID=UPI00367F2BB3
MRTIRRKIAMTAPGLLGAAALLTTSAVNQDVPDAAPAATTPRPARGCPWKVTTVVMGFLLALAGADKKSGSIHSPV